MNRLPFESTAALCTWKNSRALCPACPPMFATISSVWRFEHPDGLVRAVDDVEELLRLVRRQGEVVHGAFGLQRVPRDEHFLHERAIEPEDLEPVVRAIGDVDEIVVRHDNRVHRIVELRRRRTLNELGARRELVVVVRLLAVGAPMTLVRAGVRVEDDDAVVEVAVGDEQLVGLRVARTGRPARPGSRCRCCPCSCRRGRSA